MLATFYSWASFLRLLFLSTSNKETILLFWLPACAQILLYFWNICKVTVCGTTEAGCVYLVSALTFLLEAHNGTFSWK